MLHLTGTLQTKPYGDVSPLFLGDSEVPFLPMLQKLLKDHGLTMPECELVIGDAVSIKGKLDVFFQRSAGHESLNAAPIPLFSKRFVVGGIDCWPMLRVGARVSLRIEG